MRHRSLTAKLIAAVLPALLALGALVALGVRDGRDAAAEARLGASLGAAWDPLVATMQVIEAERTASVSGDRTAISESRRATNTQLVAMNDVLVDIGGGRTLVDQLGETLTALGLAREAVDQPTQAAARGVTAQDSYDAAEAGLVAVGALLPTRAGEPDLARELTAVAALAEIEQRSAAVAQRLADVAGSPVDPVTMDRLLTGIDQIGPAIARYRVVAPAGGLDDFRATGLSRALDDTRRSLVAAGAAVTPSVNETVTGSETTDDAADDAATDADTSVVADEAIVPAGAATTLTAPAAAVAGLRDVSAATVVADSDARAAHIEQATWIRVAVIVAVAALVALIAVVVTLSISRRVRRVSRAAHEVTTTALPALVDALHDPRGVDSLPELTPIDVRGHDEVAELARSFDTLQTALGEVAAEQLDVLHRGVSDLFVTMARRNRSLVDRQLALLDELEGDVSDPDVLADYYRLDHLATRMRRNSDSLLVLAGAETSRRRIRSTPIDTVVRAAVGEVEDYLRVDIVNLDKAVVRGVHVADLAHLLAELLDNATSFSPPDTRVRVEGALDDSSYVITITDSGMGMSGPKVRELNSLLSTPPVVGLSMDATLGMSVISLLAARHGLRVHLSSDEDGTVAVIRVPADSLEGGGATGDGGRPPAAARRTDPDVRIPEDTPSAAPALTADLTEPVTAREPALVRAADDVPAPSIGKSDRPTPAPTLADVEDVPASTSEDDAPVMPSAWSLTLALDEVEHLGHGTHATDVPSAEPTSDPSTPTHADRPEHHATEVADAGPTGSSVTNPFAAPPGSPEPVATLPPPVPSAPNAGRPSATAPVDPLLPRRRDDVAEFDDAPPEPLHVEPGGMRPVLPPRRGPRIDLADQGSTGQHADAASTGDGTARASVPTRDRPANPTSAAGSTNDVPASTPSGLPMRTRPATVAAGGERDPEVPTRPGPSLAGGERPVSPGASSPAQLGAALSAFTKGRNGERPSGPRIDLDGLDLTGLGSNGDGVSPAPASHDEEVPS